MKMRAKKVSALTDPRLAANQIIGEFEMMEEMMGKNVKLVQRISKASSSNRYQGEASYEQTP